MTTDITEKGLESIIVRAMTGRTDIVSPPYEPGLTTVPVAGGTGWLLGDRTQYDRGACVDLVQLTAFVRATQPKLVEAFGLMTDSPTRRQFLARLSSEVGKRGVIDVLRKGVDHGAHRLELFYGTPSFGNAKARKLNAENRFSATRQLAYSLDETRRALDLALFVNGLPVATFELKNSLTKQTVADAVSQYQRDRDPREPLFGFGRCVVHLAVDDSEVRFCTKLEGKASWFLPLNLGHNHGAGNPPNPDGLKTAYLWEKILTPGSLTDILENYAQIVEEVDKKTGKKKRKQIFPRYHQLEVVRRLLADAKDSGVGKRYLIQHSAGSGKSNSIAWLAHQLVKLENEGKKVFDAVVVVTDRRVLDDQIRENIKQFAQVGATVGAVTGSGGSKTKQLARFLAAGTSIVITTIQTFPFVLEEIGDAHRGRNFAIIIDEAHSSQGGKTASKMSEALASKGHGVVAGTLSEASEEPALGEMTDDGEDVEDPEDLINDALQKRADARKMLKNASYFAFTATPKNKTLEMFGVPLPPDTEGKVLHRPFHSYTMKQAIDEGFIHDVLARFTPVKSYYKLIKTTAEDPEVDVKRANKELRAFVESDPNALRRKTEIMVDHFHQSVVATGKMKGQARAMVVASSIKRAVQYFGAFQDYLRERKSPYKAIVAFSGEHDFGAGKVTEAKLNGFSSSEIVDKIQEEPYRFLICADKFQTGYDEPLLHTMYVDKGLSGIKAVQTLSRLNRSHPDKRDVVVLDFYNEADDIKAAFEPYYRTTLLSEQTDANKLSDLRRDLDNAGVYSAAQVDELVALFLGKAARDSLDPILDSCATVYAEKLDENGQVAFKGDAKSFVRTYDFLASILPYTRRDWEKLSIFLNLLIPKLPAPKTDETSVSVLDVIDLDSYRAEKHATNTIALADEDGAVGPVPVSRGGQAAQPEVDRLSKIIASFNEQFGTLFNDSDQVLKRIKEVVAPQVAADSAFKNARENTPQTARLEHDKALARVMVEVLKDDTEMYKQFVQNPAFKRFVTDMVFEIATAA